MNARIEAAVKAQAVRDYETTFNRKVNEPDLLWDSYVPDEQQEIVESMTVALEAADAVMFSDVAVERAANAICSAKILPAWFPANAAADIARAVIAALRDVPGGAVGAGGSEVAPEGAGAICGAQNGAWQFRGGDLVEWAGECGIWKVIPSNIYDDKYASIQQRNRIITAVPCEELRHVGRKP